MFVVPTWLPLLVLAPVPAELVLSSPVPDGQAGSVGSTEGRRFGVGGPGNGHPEDIRLQLHTKPVRGDASVRLQHFELGARILLHSQDQVPSLVADRLQSCPRQVSRGARPGQADYRPPRVRAPIGSEQTRESGDEINATAIVDATRQCLAFGRLSDNPELVPQPLNCRAANSDRAFQSINGRTAIHLVANSTEEPAF